MHLAPILDGSCYRLPTVDVTVNFRRILFAVYTLSWALTDVSATYVGPSMHEL